MGYRLFNDHNGPQGGWKYRVPETGIEIVEGSINQLKISIREHYAGNSLAIPSNLDDLVLEYVCKNGADCEYNGVTVEKSNSQAKKSMQLRDVVRFTKTLVHSLSNGGKVDQAEANRRAEICSGCQFNKEASGCMGCNSGPLKEVVKLLSNHGSTKYDESLKSCEFCGCFVRSLIWFPVETLRKFTDPQENKNLPVHCWKKTPCTEP